MTTFKRLTAAIAALTVLSTSMPLPAQAGVIGTQEAITVTASVQQTVRDLLARQEVRDALTARGVDPAQVDARIAALTDEEARLLAHRLDQLPAGGAEVLGVLFAIFVILLITDILGLTRVFPFTRPIR
jgi:uncharacterized small protein (DUF1192 family)